MPNYCDESMMKDRIQPCDVSRDWMKNAKQSMEEKLNMERVKNRQFRERHRLKDIVDKEYKILKNKFPKGFERILELMITEAMLKKPTRISTFFSVFLESLLLCRIRQEFGQIDGAEGPDLVGLKKKKLHDQMGDEHYEECSDDVKLNFAKF
ncbi:hypothetical protein HELRODRAFT_159419 [Helobdella robusta]|uniref:Uncharacterized protein n=1 Tax=Helobdella robusta TaxID=6412 RepID=T1EP08_HELRO|nr:hypothetical protein HELRODRAFT_159419 [Helobdella robusta]ESO12832.1 hypothetical protein HELRODRAFT_159419 [Helobdella robusta]